MSHDDGFAAVLGDAPRLDRLIETGSHEGPVYVPEQDALHFTSLPAPLRIQHRRVRGIADSGRRDVALWQRAGSFQSLFGGPSKK